MPWIVLALLTASPAAETSSLALLDDDVAAAPAELPMPPLEQAPAASEPEAAAPAVEPSAPSPQPPPAAPTPSPVVLSGLAEAYYQWNFGQPSNGITNGRGFDNRANTFTLSSALIDAKFDVSGFVGELGLQLGSASVTSYLAEPTQPGTAWVAPSGGDLWRIIQQAHVGYRVPLGRGLLVEAGIFLSPVGPEAPVSKDNWNLSRSTLFFALPFYHTGARATYALSSQLSATAAVYNGWNTVVDNNPEKSVSVSLAWQSEKLTASVLYFGGVERSGSDIGRPWRHLFDAWGQWQVSERVALLGQANVGFEQTSVGLDPWVSGAVATRVKVLDWLFVSGRADVLHEGDFVNGELVAAPIFFPATTVGSLTGTLDVRPIEHVAVRVEYRRDQANAELYFSGTVAGDGTSSPFVPNRRSQDTITLAAMGWF
ncbi:MAG: porin [Archangium sp.]|nr:porin [Archangium sp.]